jgi:hypothetical protein
MVRYEQMKALLDTLMDDDKPAENESIENESIKNELTSEYNPQSEESKIDGLMKAKYLNRFFIGATQKQKKEIEKYNRLSMLREPTFENIYKYKLSQRS